MTLLWGLLWKWESRHLLSVRVDKLGCMYVFYCLYIPCRLLQSKYVGRRVAHDEDSLRDLPHAIRAQVIPQLRRKDAVSLSSSSI